MFEKEAPVGLGCLLPRSIPGPSIADLFVKEHAINFLETGMSRIGCAKWYCASEPTGPLNYWTILHSTPIVEWDSSNSVLHIRSVPGGSWGNGVMPDAGVHTYSRSLYRNEDLVLSRLLRLLMTALEVTSEGALCRNGGCRKAILNFHWALFLLHPLATISSMQGRYEGPGSRGTL